MENNNTTTEQAPGAASVLQSMARLVNRLKKFKYMSDEDKRTYTAIYNQALRNYIEDQAEN